MRLYSAELVIIHVHASLSPFALRPAHEPGSQTLAGVEYVAPLYNAPTCNAPAQRARAVYVAPLYNTPIYIVPRDVSPLYSTPVYSAPHMTRQVHEAAERGLRRV